MVYAIEPSDLLPEESGEVGFAADCGLTLSADEPAGDHKPPRKQRPNSQINKLLQSLPRHLYDRVH